MTAGPVGVAGPDSPDPEAAQRLRAALDAADYTAATVERALGAEPRSAYSPADLVVLTRRLRERSPLNTLIKLFALGVTVDLDEASEALGPLSVTQARDAGLVAGDAGDAGVSPRVSIFAFGGMRFASDRISVHGAADRPDHVIGVGPSSITLANLTVRRPVETALDVGTGCGVQALLAARHAARVVATDINPRALAYTEFNARLNALTNVEFLLGNLFEPVASQCFDLVVAQPPFVISPDTTFTFRDSPLEGDAISSITVREAARHLTQGGYATVMCNWGNRSGQDWPDTPAGWVSGTGADAWILHFVRQDPLDYAAEWTRSPEVEEHARSLDRWLSYYRRLGMDTISSGALILRARGGDNWVRADNVAVRRVADCSDHIMRVFRAADDLAALDDRALGARRLRVIAQHELDQRLGFTDAGYAVTSLRLRMLDGLRFEGDIDPPTLHLLSRSDGTRALRDILDELPRLVAESDAASVVEAGLRTARDLIRLGFLAVAEPSGEP